MASKDGVRGAIDTLVYIFREGLGGPRSYKMLLAGLTIMAIYGIYLWVFVQHAPVFLGSDNGGLIMTGVNENVPWGLYISFFTFWVGIAASAVIFSFAAYVFGDKGFKRIVAFAEAQAVAALIITVWGIVANLGHPERALLLMPLLPNKRSMLDWDFIVIFTYMILNAIAFVYTIHVYRKQRKLPYKFIVVYMIISTPFAIGIHTVTAWIFHALTARPALNTALLAPRFIATAFASGPALILLILYILEWSTGWFRVDLAVYKKTLNVIIIALTTGLFFTLAEVHEAFWYTTEPLKKQQLIETFLGGHYPLLTTLTWLWIAFGVAAVLLGILPPMRNSKSSIALISLLTVIGVVAEKTLATILPGFIINPLGLPSDYTITPMEIFVGVGIHATVFLLLVILIRAYLVTVKRLGVDVF
ncbi:MAG: polysulfide reductase NrfD [Desulfurococcales archaeon]|nr:polysulfide reductase NrfD [Desulfurococcales archaeon]